MRWTSHRVVKIDGALVCICRACTDPPPRRPDEPTVDEVELLEVLHQAFPLEPIMPASSWDELGFAEGESTDASPEQARAVLDVIEEWRG